MRPLVAPTDLLRAHPTYTVNPATDVNLLNAITVLRLNAQEEGLLYAEIERLRGLGKKRGKIDESELPKGADQALTYIRTNWLTNWNDSQRLTLMLDYMPDYYKKIRARYKSEIEKYKTARGDLLNTLGYYCSYCEIPVGIGVHVEHKLPKVDFPANAVEWDNLLLACDNCNSNKGEQPARSIGVMHPIPNTTVIPQPPLVGPLLATTETASQDGSGSYFPWPDDPNYPGYGAFSYRMMRVAYDAFGNRTAAEPIDPGDLDVWVLNGRVSQIPPYFGKDIRGRFNGQVWEVELHMVPSRALGDDWYQKADNMIRTFDLNRDKKKDLRQLWNSDLRVPLRTVAWFKAVAARPRLVNAYLRDARLQDLQLTGFNEMVTAVMDTAISSGFWSVWRHVFASYVSNDVIRAAMLAPLYRQEYFPATRQPQ